MNLFVACSSCYLNYWFVSHKQWNGNISKNHSHIRYLHTKEICSIKKTSRPLWTHFTHCGIKQINVKLQPQKWLSWLSPIFIYFHFDMFEIPLVCILYASCVSLSWRRNWKGADVQDDRNDTEITLHAFFCSYISIIPFIHVSDETVIDSFSHTSSRWAVMKDVLS